MTKPHLFHTLIAPVVFLFLWAAGYVVAKVGLQYSGPMTLLGLRFGLVVLLMGVLFLILRPALPKTLADWGHLAVDGVLMQTVYFGLAYMAFVNGIAAGTAALVMSLQPVLVALIAPRWTGERVSWRQWLGLGIALAGTAVVIAARLDIGAPTVLGFVLAGLSLMGICAATLWEKRFGLSHHPVTANLIGYAAGLAGLLPFLVLSAEPAVIWSSTFIWALGYLVIGNSVIAVGLLLAMIRAGEVSRVSALMFLVPPLSALMAWQVLGEVMPPIAWGGIVLAGLGVWLATAKRLRRV